MNTEMPAAQSWYTGLCVVVNNIFSGKDINGFLQGTLLGLPKKVSHFIKSIRTAFLYFSSNFHERALA